MFLPNYVITKGYIKHIDGFVEQEEPFLQLFVLEELLCIFGDLEKDLFKKFCLIKQRKYMAVLAE
jgi:hypothetical protein